MGVGPLMTSASEGKRGRRSGAIIFAGRSFGTLGGAQLGRARARIGGDLHARPERSGVRSGGGRSAPAAPPQANDASSPPAGRGS